MAGTRGSGISPVQQEYLDILRSALWGQTPQNIPKDVEGVLAIADIQKTRPLILDALQKAGYEGIGEDAWAVIYRNTASHLALNRFIAKLVPLFRESGIDPVLLKGQGVAVNYPEPVLRECGDIDLYVGEQKYQAACELLKSMADGSATSFESEKEKHYHLCINGVHVELHRYCDTSQIRRENVFLQSIADAGLSRDLVPVEIGEVSLNTPADSFNAFYLFYHIWHHFIFEGIGLRQFCDWTLFLHSRAGKLDTSVIEVALKKLHLQAPWQYFASIAVDYLGLPPSEMPFYKADCKERAADYLAIILQDGNFGHGSAVPSKRPSGSIAGKWHTISMILRKSRHLFGIFPELRPLLFLFAVGEVKAGINRTVKESLHK